MLSLEIDCKIAYDPDIDENKNNVLMLSRLIQLSPKLKTLKLYRFDILKIHTFQCVPYIKSVIPRFPIPYIPSLTNF